MNKLKLFLENFMVYGLGGIINKIIPLIMVPIVTRLMTDTRYYGISDLASTIISFASTIAVMGMYDAMYRMFFEKDDEIYKKEICSTVLSFTIVTSVIISIVMVLFKEQLSKIFFGDSKYSYLIYIAAIATLVGVSNQIVSAPTRMQNKRKIYLVTNVMSSVISYSIAIPLLVNGYYIIALPVAMLLSNLFIEIVFVCLNKRWFKLKKININLLKKLLVIGIPLLPSFLIYWLFNSSDKMMITNLMDVEAAGIYSVGAKLGHASQLIYTAFAGGWQYFAFSTMKEDNQVVSNSRVFEYLGIISFVATMFICAWSYPIYKVLFVGDYVGGYIVSPYLFFAPLLQMLFQVGCSQFVIIKKTWPNMLILSVGAILNILLNFILIPLLGIEGAAISTVVGYAVSLLICVIILLKIKLMVISKRFIVTTVMTIMFIILWRVCFKTYTFIGTLMAFMFAAVFIFLYKRDIKELVSALNGTGNERKKNKRAQGDDNAK